jgi:hypothetical protein
MSDILEVYNKVNGNPDYDHYTQAAQGEWNVVSSREFFLKICSNTIYSDPKA